MIVFKWLANFLTFNLLGLTPGSKLGNGVHFFIEDTSKIFILLILMIYVIGLVRAGLPIERIRNFLSGRNRLVSYFLAALLGAVTPFCSCSSIPLFLGFTAARIPLGITMAFLITSPMINEAAVVMLGGIVGWGLTGIYIAFGMLAGIIGGIFFDAIRAERWVELETPKKQCGCCCKGGDDASEIPAVITWRYRHNFAKNEAADIFKRIWLWVVVGIALGALLHGFVPDEFIAEKLGGGKWWSVPLAVAVGIPTYANATGVIPIIGALISKGLPVGTAFAFMLSTAAVSLPEFIMLKKVMTVKLLLIFALYLLVFFTCCGWILNLIYQL
ncbi:MAG: permease [Victivallaceae bacterium]